MSATFNFSFAQTLATTVDLNKYAGKWFVIASIPTKVDKNWNFVTESYTLKANGNIAIYTTYLKQNKTKQHSMNSKGFPNNESKNFAWKVKFWWSFKIDYLIEELPEDYSYVIVGHPKKEYLYIMSRKNLMEQEQYQTLVEHCKQKGYDISKIKKIPQ